MMGGKYDIMANGWRGRQCLRKLLSQSKLLFFMRKLNIIDYCQLQVPLVVRPQLVIL